MCTFPPIKDVTSYENIRSSEWLESMRKDNEFTFDILKGRWAILRYRLRFGNVNQCDKLWLTCCALHNRLFFIDELHKSWVTGEFSDWEKITKST